MSEVTYFILYILQHNKGRHQPFWSDPLNPIFCLLFFLAGTLRSLPVQVRLLLVLAAAQDYCNFNGIFPCFSTMKIVFSFCTGPQNLGSQPWKNLKTWNFLDSTYRI